MLLLLWAAQKYRSSKRFSTLTCTRTCWLSVANTAASTRANPGSTTVLSVATNRSLFDTTPRPKAHIPVRLYLFQSENACRGTWARRAPATTVGDSDLVILPSCQA